MTYVAKTLFVSEAAQVVVSRSIGSVGSRRRTPKAALQTTFPRSRTTICAPVTRAAASVLRAKASASAVVMDVPSKRRMDVGSMGSAPLIVLGILHPERVCPNEPPDH
jgi:hypothetical protein